MRCTVSPPQSLVRRQGMGAMLLPFTQKVPREAAVEGKQQQWSLSVSRFQPFSPISRHSKQQFSCLQPLS